MRRTGWVAIAPSASGSAAYDRPAVARWVAEPAKEVAQPRAPFARDRARVLHSAALRRLAGKTQVERAGLHDFPRTRLTHSLECAQIGRELATAVGADPDAVDAGCLAHDLGHPPFGHNGEAALDEASAGCGGFEGNAQSLRLLTRLEAKVPGAGLNLTRAVLDAATKYPWPRTAQHPTKYGVYADDRAVFDWVRAGAPEQRRCVEAQIMDWADDVAYSVHDLEDGIVAGKVPLAALTDAAERAAIVRLAGQHYSAAPPDELAEALNRTLALPFWPSDHDGSQRSLIALKRLTSELIGRFCHAAVQATRAQHAGPVGRYDGEFLAPPSARAECAVLKAVTAHYVMFTPAAARLRERQRVLLLELVDAVAARAPDSLEPPLAEAFRQAAADAERLRVVVDQVASLTDASARDWHGRLCR